MKFPFRFHTIQRIFKRSFNAIKMLAKHRMDGIMIRALKQVI